MSTEIRITNNLVELLEIKRVRSVKLEDFVAQVAMHHLQITPVLPSDTIVYAALGGRACVLTLVKASRRTIKFGGEKLDLNLPDIYFLVKLRRAAFDSVKIFFGNAPVFSLESHLCYPCFYNIYPDGKLCLGNVSIYDLQSDTIKSTVAKVVHHFFNSEFTLELPPRNLPKPFEDISVPDLFSAWAKLSPEDISKIEWLEYPKNIKETIKDELEEAE